MTTHILKNDTLMIELKEQGAELTSILDHRTNTQYLWKADPTYWRRHSPILFPIVGSLKNKSYSYQGQAYSLPQHGFARDMMFTLINQTENEIWFSLDATEDTRKVYPFNFTLELGYRLEGRTITAFWRVINKDQSIMYFSIGGHPAFNCPLKQGEEQSDYYISFDTEQPIHYLHVDETGFVNKKPFEQQNVLTTDHGVIPIDPHMFDYDALIIENNQCHQVSFLDAAKKPYLSVSFDAPLFGIWSPPKKKAPFICVEPWYGLCDANDFEGTLEEKEWINLLEAGKTFEASYRIDIV
jgi:galactose mutarotase-like enzyme